MKNLPIYVFFVLFFMFCFSANTKAQTEDTSKNEDKIYSIKEVDEKAQVIKPEFVKTNGSCEGSGTIALRVVFHKNGEVTDIKVVNPSPCKIFNNKAVKVAKKIKFKPALKNGVAVSQYQSLEYSYKSL